MVEVVVVVVVAEIDTACSTYHDTTQIISDEDKKFLIPALHVYFKYIQIEPNMQNGHDTHTFFLAIAVESSLAS